MRDSLTLTVGGYDARQIWTRTPQLVNVLEFVVCVWCGFISLDFICTLSPVSSMHSMRTQLVLAKWKCANYTMSFSILLMTKLKTRLSAYIHNISCILLERKFEIRFRKKYFEPV